MCRALRTNFAHTCFYEMALLLFLMSSYHHIRHCILCSAIFLPVCLLLFISVSKIIVFLRNVIAPSHLRVKFNPHLETIVVFHPNCNGGGGGERVLWVGLNGILQRKKYNVVIISSTDSRSDVLGAVSRNFDIDTSALRNVEFINVSRLLGMLSPNSYPAFTVLGQSLGTMCLILLTLILNPRLASIHSINKRIIFLDTVGTASFSFPWIRLIFPTWRVISYTHYPLMSYDMLQRVKSKEKMYNNSSSISASSRKVRIARSAPWVTDSSEGHQRSGGWAPH